VPDFVTLPRRIKPFVCCQSSPLSAPASAVVLRSTLAAFKAPTRDCHKTLNSALRQVRPSSRAQRVQEVGLRQMAVVASGAAPQKAGAAAAPASGSGTRNAPPPDGPSAEAEASAATAQPAPVEAAPPATPAAMDATELVAVGEREPPTADAAWVLHLDSQVVLTEEAVEPQSALKTSAAPPPHDSASRDGAAEPSAEVTQACGSDFHAPAAAPGSCGADVAEDRPSPAAPPVAAAAGAASTERAVDPVENSMPTQGQVTFPSGQSSTGTASETGVIESALARSASPSTDVRMPESVATES